MDTQISDEINTMTSSITGSNAEVVSFVSDKNTNVDSVQFVMKTAAIEKAEAAVSDVVEEAPLSFWQKLLRLFGLYGSFLFQHSKAAGVPAASACQKSPFGLF